MVAVAVLGLVGTGAIAQEADAVAEDTGAMAQAVSFDGFKGTGNLGIIYTGDTENDAGVITKKSGFTMVSNFDLAMSGSGTTDGGLTFGAGATIKAGQSESVVGASNAYIGSESWQISIGDLDPASHKGRNLGDVGFDGLGVEDIAQDISSGTAADVQVKFTLGTAELLITAGSDPDSGKARTAAKYQLVTTGTDSGYVVSDIRPGQNQYFHTNATTGTITLFNVVGLKDPVTPGTAGTETDENDTTLDSGPDTPVEFSGQRIRVAPGTGTAATKQDTQWAAGASFAVGSTTLGIGMDSEKLIQASVGANLGSFGGKLFFAQQKDKVIDISGDKVESTEANTVRNKKTGIGAEISVSAGANTTINAVYSQAKHSDTRKVMVDAADDTTKSLSGNGKAISKTTKGFGVGVTHILGGGAKLQAGFAKVADVSKASIGVAMEF